MKFFRRHGIRRIRRVLTDNSACLEVFAAALRGSRSRHKRIRAYRPQTNGKVERYHWTLAREWAYRGPGQAKRPVQNTAVASRAAAAFALVCRHAIAYGGRY